MPKNKHRPLSTSEDDDTTDLRPSSSTSAAGMMAGPLDSYSTPSGSILPLKRSTIMIISLVLILTIIPTVILSNPTSNLSSQPQPQPVKIAYGSCTSYSMESLPLLSLITRTNPTHFIWLGDVLYLDDPITDCNSPTYLESCGCQNTDFIRIPPHSCYSGDAEHARFMWEFFRETEWVNHFVEYFKSIKKTEEDYRMIGVYDDHDFGWNNGNRRMPEKQIFKEMFLDFLDVPNDSIRRRHLEGVQDHVVISDDIEVRSREERSDEIPT
ncbi:hypothetical protein TL16_g10670 [Triparma laevis f. inornata]|uniref:PhoD-like phosphatase metallophosphatase domain-containing protein n=1 Tax=Triparma laevis f. inornata TaxID=1714386 RepID=A0A9W7BF84_9STRA|nr:hypothetical protein TL16_g10670 [Triparma laevis f. inornata]